MVSPPTIQSKLQHSRLHSSSCSPPPPPAREIYLSPIPASSMATSRPLMRGIHPPHVFPKRGGRTSPYDVALTALLIASALLLALIAFGVISLPVSAPTATTGGEAESTDSRPTRPRGRRDLSEGLGEQGAQWTEVISWEPRAFVYHNFLVSLLTENGNSKDDLRQPTDDNLLS